MHFLFQNRNESRFTIKAFIRLCHALHVSEQLGENGPYWFSRNVCHADMRRELIRVFLAWVPFTFDLIRDSTSMTEQEGGYSLPRHLPGYLPAEYTWQQGSNRWLEPWIIPPLRHSLVMMLLMMAYQGRNFHIPVRCIGVCLRGENWGYVQ